MEEIKYRFYVTGVYGSREVFPKNGNTFSVNYEKPEERAFFSKKFKGTFIFKAEDFLWFYKLEKSSYRCQPIKLEIKKLCNGNLVPFYSCNISLNDGKNFDLDEGMLSIQVTDVDKYTCFEENKDEERNILNFVPSDEVVTLLKGTIEKLTCSDFEGNSQQPVWCGTGVPEDAGWTILSNTVDIYNDTTPPTSAVTTVWVREKLTSVTALPSPWINIGGNEYAKKPALHTFRQFNSPNNFGYEYQTGGSVDNGMKLRSVFEYFLSNFCGGYTLKSNFFQWNPDVVTTINYVTLQQSKVLNLILFQTSDVKRPNVSGNATIAEITFEELVVDICNIFNLRWDFDDNKRFVIEHVSFFKKGIGMNLVTRYDKRKRIGQMKYYFDKDKMPKRELFKTDNFENQVGDFRGFPIEYAGSCVGKGDVKEKEFILKKIQTDMELAFNNPEPDSKLIGDENFFLVACDALNSIIVEPAVVSNVHVINNSLSWARLHIDYWRFERVLNNFKMNETPNTALSVIRTKKGVKMDVSLCCGDEFDPEKIMISELGNGAVGEAEFKLYDELLQVTLLYDPEEGINTSEPPTAVNDEAELFHDTIVDIEVANNDSDLGGSLDLNSMEVVVQPSHGTAVAVGGGKIRYIPSAGFIGVDQFQYKIRDNEGNPSNIATVDVNVKAGSPVPVAAVDSFMVASDSEFISTGSVMTNDSGTPPLTVTPVTKATTHGNVQIFANGTFKYNPSPGYIGNDSFTYELNSGDGQSVNGTVNLEVFSKQNVYIRYSEENAVGSPTTGDCPNQPNTIIGSKVLVTAKYKFFSDAAGTIPLNIRDYLLEIKMKQIKTDFNTGDTVETTYNVYPDNYGTGALFQLIFPDTVKQENYNGCGDIGAMTSFGFEYQIISSPNYIIL